MKKATHYGGLILACLIGFIIRPIFPGHARAASADPISVLCSTCTVGATSFPYYTIIRDESTGQVFAYPHMTGVGSGSLETHTLPVYLGTLSPGKPII
jgi:hypothetical protein